MCDIYYKYLYFSNIVYMKGIWCTIVKIVIYVSMCCMQNARIDNQFTDLLKEIEDNEFHYLVPFANIHWLNCGRF